jgi:hypothetical protein
VGRRLTDAVTGLAARAFPPSRREDARVVRDCARDAVEGDGLRTLVRQSLSVAGAGLRVRLRADARDVRRAPWRPALAALTLPLAAAFLCVWTFGFVARYDHWPLGEGWTMLLGGSLLALIGAALAARWAIVAGAAAIFVAAGAPYVGSGTEVEVPGDTPSFFYAQGVDLGAASLIPALLLAGAALSLPRRPERSLRTALDRLVLGLLPTAVALVHLLPRPEPQPTIGFAHMRPPERGRVVRLEDAEIVVGDPYPYPWLAESGPLIAALGIALLVAVVFTWRAARTRPELALGTALVLMSVAWPLAWRLHGYAVWPHILVPLGAALALTLRGAHAGPRSSSATPTPSS